MGERISAPLFSVVIPLYNKADTVIRTLQSVEQQTFRDFEVVIVDDGSSDNGQELASGFNSSFKKRIHSQENAGVSAARNMGAELAHGQFLAFLDADDLWDSDYLSELERLINEHKDAAIVGTGFFFYNGNKQYRTNYRGGADCAALNTVALFQSYHTSSVAINRECFMEVGGFDPNHGYYEDIECFFKIELRFPGRIYVSGRALSYHMNDASWAITKSCENKQSPHLDLVEQMLSFDESVLLKRFASRFALYRFAYNSRHFMVDRNREFIRRYPKIGGEVLFQKIFTSTMLAFFAWFVSNIIIVVRKFLYCRIVKRVKRREN